MRIIDAHSHFMPPEVARHTTFFKVNWSDINKHLHLMDEQEIEKSLLLYPTSDAHMNMGGWKNVAQVYNTEISRVVHQHPDRFIGAGIVPMDQPDQILEFLQRFEELNLKVISLASSYNGKFLDEEMFLPIFQFASEENLVIHVHPQIMNPIGEERVKDPLLSPVLEYVFDVSMCIGKMLMSGTFLQFSDLKIIFAHYGGVLPLVKERFDTTYNMLRSREFVKDLSKSPSEYFKNLYFDTSGSKSLASLLCALELTDPKHILFGSDYPANQNIGNAKIVIENSDLAEAQKADILTNNLEALLFK